jgi:hypothetical protein
MCPADSDAGVGACLHCVHPGCDNAFHVTCALKWGLFEDAIQRQKVEMSDFASLQLQCHHHGGRIGEVCIIDSQQIQPYFLL